MLQVYTGDCVLPGQTLSLHVVEPRYLLMVRTCATAAAPSFAFS